MSIGRFDTAFLPSVEYMKCLASCEAFFIDGNRMWQKQTVRNRAFILSPNGVQTLTVPIEHTGGKKVPVSDIRISYAGSWMRQHLGALDSAYNRSAFYPYFREELHAIYESRPQFLLDFNTQLTKWLMKRLAPRAVLLDNDENNHEGRDYTLLSDSGTSTPVMTDVTEFTPYLQVFCDRMPFLPNLSALDALANQSRL